MSRPRIPVDVARVAELAARGLTAEQIAAALALEGGPVVSRATVQRRLAEESRKGEGHAR